MTGRNRVDAFLGRSIRAAANREESGDVLLVEISNSCLLQQRLQTAGPLFQPEPSAVASG